MGIRFLCDSDMWEDEVRVGGELYECKGLFFGLGEERARRFFFYLLSSRGRRGSRGRSWGLFRRVNSLFVG